MNKKVEPEPRKSVPVAMFPCARVDIYGNHYMNAYQLYWWEGDEEYKPGWYCMLCAKDMPDYDVALSLADEVLRRGLEFKMVLFKGYEIERATV